MKCPMCGDEVSLVAIYNQRNNKWTALPLEFAEGDELGNFILTEKMHEAFGVLGDSLGMLPVAEYTGSGVPSRHYRSHTPSHFLGVDYVY